MPQAMEGQVLARAATIVDRANRDIHTTIDRAEVRFSWDAHRHVLIVPFQVQSGGNQFTMRATLEAPADSGAGFGCSA